jgi:hypothetical protein
MSQITTCTFFKLEVLNKLWAFSQMQLGHAHFKNIEGLVFYKLLGSGAENGLVQNQTLVLMHYYVFGYQK